MKTAVNPPTPIRNALIAFVLWSIGCIMGALAIHSAAIILFIASLFAQFRSVAEIKREYSRPMSAWGAAITLICVVAVALTLIFFGGFPKLPDYDKWRPFLWAPLWAIGVAALIWRLTRDPEQPLSAE
jgi:hypothetical protein